MSFLTLLRFRGIRLDNVLKRQRIWTIGDFAGLSEDEVAGLAFVKEPKLENVRQVLRGYKPVRNCFRNAFSLVEVVVSKPLSF